MLRGTSLMADEHAGLRIRIDTPPGQCVRDLSVYMFSLSPGTPGVHALWQLQSHVIGA